MEMGLGCASRPPPDRPDPPQVAHEHPLLAQCAERAIFLRDRMCGASAVTTPLLGQPPLLGRAAPPRRAAAPPPRPRRRGPQEEREAERTSTTRSSTSDARCVEKLSGTWFKT